MRSPMLAAAVLLLLPFAAPAQADWLPVCKTFDADVAPYVIAHVEPDCDHSAWVVVCPDGVRCTKVTYGFP